MAVAAAAGTCFIEMHDTAPRSSDLNLCYLMLSLKLRHRYQAVSAPGWHPKTSDVEAALARCAPDGHSWFRSMFG